MALTHSTVATGTNDGTKQVSVTAWNAGHTIDSSGVDIPSSSTLPTAPAAANGRHFTRALAGKQLGGILGPDGQPVAFAPHPATQRIMRINPQEGVTTLTQDGVTVTQQGTITLVSGALTTAATRMRKVRWASAAAINSMAGFGFGGARYITVGSGAGVGGFFMHCRFGVGDAVTTGNPFTFVGMQAANPNANNAPNTLLNCVGMAALSTDTSQWYMVYGGSAAQTAIALGTALGGTTGANPPTAIYDLVLYAPSNATTVNYQVTNVTSGVVVSGTLTGTSGTALPASTTALQATCFRSTNTGTTAVNFDLVSFYVEMDY